MSSNDNNRRSSTHKRSTMRKASVKDVLDSNMKELVTSLKGGKESYKVQLVSMSQGVYDGGPPVFSRYTINCNEKIDKNYNLIMSRARLAIINKLETRFENSESGSFKMGLAFYTKMYSESR